MGGDHPGRVFISYSRKDGAAFARALRATLEKQNLSVWQDLIDMEGGQYRWSQIENALRSRYLQHFTLVVTAAALESGVVRQEIRLARQEGKSVCPVRGPGVVDLNKLPRWLGHVYDLDLPEQRTALVGRLQRDAEPRPVPMMAPELPADFVARPREFDRLKARLLDPEGDSIAGITAALRGAGGYGKTTLAKALARDPDVQDAYFDGILWAELGEKPERLTATLSDLVTWLSGERPPLETINAVAAKLGETLGDRRILMVVDDAWRKPDLEPFLQGGRHCIRLVTTRIDSVLPEKAVAQKVDAMQGSEALSLLSGGLPQDQATRERASLQSLAARLGEWPLLLKIVNGFLRNRALGGEPVPVALAGANKRLDAKGLTVFDAGEEAQRADAVARTIGVSLDLLSETEQERFVELGAFPEDADIPVGVVGRLWAETGGLADFETEDLLGKLFDLSLLLERDLGQGFLRLHDTLRHFLRDRAGKERLIALHKALVTSLDGAGAATDERTRRYFYRRLTHHLDEAGEREKLDALLLDPAWLKAKLDATRNPVALFLDYQQYGAGEAQSLVGRALRLIGGICARDPSQLLPQLIGRLTGCEAAPLPSFVETAGALVSGPAIVPLRPGLVPPSAETARLEGHAGKVFALRLLPDGRLASGSDDKTIRLWDVTTGTEIARFEGLAGEVTVLCPLPDGRLASGSSNGPIQLWNVASGAETARLEGHHSHVSALCPLPDGRLASGSDDKTIRLWDATTGVERRRLKGHGAPVTALSLLRDGRLASASEDETVRFWDVTTGVENGRLEHGMYVKALCLLPDGRLASASSGLRIHLWDVTTETETETAYLRGEYDYINALCPLPDGRLASGSLDNTILLWDTASGTETARLDGHNNGVHSLCLLPDGRLASGSSDKTIRLWDVTAESGISTAERHTDAVVALCLLSDGQLASASRDRTIRLWDVATGAETARLQGHKSAVVALCNLPGGRLASGSLDKTIRMWDLTSGTETASLNERFGNVMALCALRDGLLASGSFHGRIRLLDAAAGTETAVLFGHRDLINALCLLPDGRLASASRDTTIRLWDVTARAETARLVGHTAPVTALCPLPDGRLASGSYDDTIRLWDLKNGVETERLEGHSIEVNALCVLPDGRLASSLRDNTIRLWDVGKGTEIARLELDAPVRPIAAPRPNLIVAGDDFGRLHWLEVRG
jgi:WD40 repeat protein